jgi:hypothetical protein
MVKNMHNQWLNLFLRESQVWIALLDAGILLGLLFSPGDQGDMLIQTPAVTITQYYYIPETKLFIATALRTSNSTRMKLLGITVTLKVANVYKLNHVRDCFITKFTSQ